MIFLDNNNNLFTYNNQGIIIIIIIIIITIIEFFYVDIYAEHSSYLAICILFAWYLTDILVNITLNSIRKMTTLT